MPHDPANEGLEGERCGSERWGRARKEDCATNGNSSNSQMAKAYAAAHDPGPPSSGQVVEKRLHLVVDRRRKHDGEERRRRGHEADQRQGPHSGRIALRCVEQRVNAVLDAVTDQGGGTIEFRRALLKPRDRHQRPGHDQPIAELVRRARITGLVRRRDIGTWGCRSPTSTTPGATR